MRGVSDEDIEKHIEEHKLLKHISYQLLDYCINLAYKINSFDKIMNLLRDLRKDAALRKVLKDFDKKSGLNYFLGGVERAVAKYKARLMKAIFTVLDNMGYEVNEKKLGRLKEEYIILESNSEKYKETFEQFLYSMCFELKEYLGDEEVFLND